MRRGDNVGLGELFFDEEEYCVKCDKKKAVRIVAKNAMKEDGRYYDIELRPQLCWVCLHKEDENE
jgi:hypothetical protein